MKQIKLSNQSFILFKVFAAVPRTVPSIHNEQSFPKGLNLAPVCVYLKHLWEGLNSKLKKKFNRIGAAIMKPISSVTGEA